MKSNVFKFLVKSVLFTASTMIPGDINGMEAIELPSCAICLKPLCGHVYSLQCNGKDGINHDFHIECIQAWIGREECCPMCRKPLSEKALFEIREYTPIDIDRICPGLRGYYRSVAA